jgi:4-amino-4-deoxy-L-arabinose transferase-like glycosyltransferase
MERTSELESAPADKSAGNKLDWILVALCAAVGFGLRLAYLLGVPPFLDEYSSMLTGLSILQRGGLPELPSGVLYPSGSLFSYLEAAFFGLFGFSDAVARLPSLVIGVLTLPLFYLVARRMLNRPVALLSVALLAVMPEAVVWGGRARMYALLQLLVLLAVYFFYRNTLESRPPSAIGGRPRNGAQPFPPWPWVVCFLAAIFAQDEAILLLPIFWLAALIARGLRWFFRPGVLIAQVLLPVAGVAARYWLNEVRVPGEVYTLAHDAFFRFPPALAHGLGKVAPFFADPWALPLTLLFLVALGFLARDYYVSKRTPQAHKEARGQVSRLVAPAFVCYLVLAITAAIVLVVNDPWQDDRYLFMVLPQFLMAASWGLGRLVTVLGQRWPVLRTRGASIALVAVVTVAFLPAGLSALRRYEPDYSAAYRWVATQIADDDLVVTVRPAPAAVYLGRCDYLASEDKHQEFIMRLNGEWVDRWAGAKVVESPEAFRDQVLGSGQRVWFVIDEDRFESVSYSPEFVALILEQMDLVWHQGGVLVFQGEGYRPPPEMTVAQSLDANFGDQLRLTGYALSTDQPEPGDEVVLNLYWQAIHPERNYTVFVHVVGADGQGLTQVDGQPFLGLYSMATHWPRDRSVTDTRRLSLPSDTPPGRYRLEVGLYDADDPDAEPLPVLDAAGNPASYSVVLDYLHVDTPSSPEPTQLVPEGTLGGLVRLVGYDPPLPTQFTAGTSLPLTLTWESLAAMEADYTVFIHLVGASLQPLAQVDSQPLGGTYPTRFWDVGERLADPHLLSVPLDVPSGEYELIVGMYLPSTGERLSLLNEDGEILGDSISLGQVRVVSP